MLVDWKDLPPEARELLAKLLEGRDYEITDESLATLEERGLIELSVGSWRVTSVGRSVYVIRDQWRPVHPDERRQAVNLRRRLTSVQQP
jgi:hypothetical protein